MEIYIYTHWISIVGAVIGLIYLYLEYKAHIGMWLASIVMAAFYSYIFYSTHLYASMGIYIYFLFASIYGWMRWQGWIRIKNKDRDDYKEQISNVPKQQILPIIFYLVISFGLLYFLLLIYSSNELYITVGDAITTSLNIVALWMISHRWIEQWLLLIPANILSSLLLFAQGDVLSGTLFCVFTLVSVAGYFKWKKIALLEM